MQPRQASWNSTRNPGKGISSKAVALHELWSKLLKAGYIRHYMGDLIGEYCRAY